MLGDVNKRLNGSNVDFRNREIATLVAGDLTGFTAIEVVLAAFAFEEFSSFGDNHALSEGLGCLLFHSVMASSC